LRCGTGGRSAGRGGMNGAGRLERKNF